MKCIDFFSFWSSIFSTNYFDFIFPWHRFIQTDPASHQFVWYTPDGTWLVKVSCMSPLELCNQSQFLLVVSDILESDRFSNLPLLSELVGDGYNVVKIHWRPSAWSRIDFCSKIPYGRRVMYVQEMLTNSLSLQWYSALPPVLTIQTKVKIC